MGKRSAGEMQLGHEREEAFKVYGMLAK